MNVRDVATQINTAIADAIPELVLKVITLQDAKQRPTQELLSALGGVSQTAKVLGDVAIQVADEQYEEFPEIKEEILTHANECLAVSATVFDVA